MMMIDLRQYSVSITDDVLCIDDCRTLEQHLWLVWMAHSCRQQRELVRHLLVLLLYCFF